MAFSPLRHSVRKSKTPFSRAWDAFPSCHHALESQDPAEPSYEGLALFGEEVK